MGGNGMTDPSQTEHPSLEELSEHLAGLPVERPGTEGAGIAEHLASCRACSAEMLALTDLTASLAALPPLPMPDDVWVRTRHRLDSGRRTRRFPHWAPAAAAVAAALLGVGVLYLGYGVTTEDGAQPPSLVAGSQTPAPARGAAEPPAESLRSPSSDEGGPSAATLLSAPDACGTYGTPDSLAWRFTVGAGTQSEVPGPAGLRARLAPDLESVVVQGPTSVQVVAVVAAVGDDVVVGADPPGALSTSGATIDAVLVCYVP